MANYIFGIDVGGTTIKCGLFTGTGELCEKWEIPTDRTERGEHILSDIAETILNKTEEKQIGRSEIIGIGLGIPGPVQRHSIVRKCVNLGWDVKDVAQELSALTGIEVKAGNDANVAALGEMINGGGKGYKNLVMITLGTGVGGGIIINGKIIEGENGAAGEIGHIPTREDETECCGCGNKGCLEQYASATGIVHAARKLLSEKIYKTELQDNEELTAERIFSLAAKKDEFALDLVEYYGKLLGKAMAQISCVVNPGIFVLGGGVSKAGDLLLGRVKKYYRQYAFHASKDTKIELAQLGNDAGIYGSMGLFL